MIGRRLFYVLTNTVTTRLLTKSGVIITSNPVSSKRVQAQFTLPNLLQSYQQLSTMSGSIVNYEDVNTLKDDANVYVIDVREPSELQETGCIPNSINIPSGDVEKSLKNMSGADFEAKYKRAKPDASALIIFSCKSGKRAAAATDKAIKLGFNNVKTYGGSWMDWEKHLK